MTTLPAPVLEDIRMANRLSGILDRSGKYPPRTEPVSFGLAVPGMARDIWVKMASTRSEWIDAARLVTDNYRERGYEMNRPDQIRFTSYHALPDTVVFIAQDHGKIVMTMSVVSDNLLLGLPMEELYHAEIAELRAQGRRIVEVTSLADQDLSLREFIPVFTAMMRMVAQYSVYSGTDTWVIAINPRHRRFYGNVMGFIPFGPLRNYPFVQNHPAEAYMTDLCLVRTNAPNMYDQLFRDWIPPEDLLAYPMPQHLIREFSESSSQTTVQEVDCILDWIATFGSPRRW